MIKETKIKIFDTRCEGFDSLEKNANAFLHTLYKDNLSQSEIFYEVKNVEFSNYNDKAGFSRMQCKIVYEITRRSENKRCVNKYRSKLEEGSNEE